MNSRTVQLELMDMSTWDVCKTTFFTGTRGHLLDWHRRRCYTSEEWDPTKGFCFCFKGPHLQHMELPRLRVKLEM